MKKNANTCEQLIVQNGRGFTLIELMVVVAIIGILTAIAFPSYQNSIRKAHRVDAKNAVLDLAARQEKYFATNNKYADDATKLGYGSAFPVDVISSGSSVYQLNVETTDASATRTDTGFTAKATPTGAQQKDACYTYAINDLGTESNFGPTNDVLALTDCW